MTEAHVLLVDDRPENLLSLDAVLAQPGRVIHQAQSGPDALRLLLKQRFACVLLDVQMPGMDGFEVARLIRARKATADTPILFVTAFSREEQAVFTGYESGAVDYLFKPLDPQIVRSKVDVFIRLEAQRLELEALNRTLEDRVRDRTAKLAVAEARYRGLVEQVPAAVYTAEPDRTGVLQFMSPQALAVTGFPPERWLDEPDLWQHRLHPDDVAHTLAAVKRAQQGSGELRVEYRLLGPDDVVRWIRDEARISVDPGGGARLLRGLMLDITETRELQHQVERTQKLESVGQLAGGIAHDFNNLLSVVLGFASLARIEDDPALRDEALDHVQRAAERGASLTRRLLSFAREQAVRPQTLDAGEALGHIAALLARVLPENVAFTYARPGEPLWIEADPVPLEQVIINLALNARDAMPTGGSLTLDASPRDTDRPRATATGVVPPGSWVVLSVQDTGTGIDPETIERIFEPFFTTKGPDKGTGLGLASSVGIVERAQGRVEVFSQVGEGTRFEVWLPRRDPPSAHIERPQGEDPSGQAKPGESVLIVEDDRTIRELLGASLARFGYRVHGAGHADEALALVADGLAFDLVLTDMTMPGMPGTALIEALRSERPDLPALLLSGRAAPAELEELDDVVFIQKPARPGAVAHAIRKLLDAAGG